MRKDISNLTRLGELVILCDKESDKGLVLSLTALIETTIQEIVFAFLVDNKASKDLAPSAHAPISKRVSLACSLGLISTLEMKTIKNLCTVRNEFAHGWNATFEIPKISKGMAVLADTWLKFDAESNRRFREKTHRELFRSIALMLLTDLVHRAKEVRKYKLHPIEWNRVTWQRKMEE